MKLKHLLTLPLLLTLYTNAFAQTTIKKQVVSGGTGIDNLVSVCMAKDGGFLAVGYSNSDSSADKSQGSNGLFAIWIVKFKRDGLPGSKQVQWEKTISRPDENIYVTKAISCTDGGYLVACQITQPPAFEDAWLVKIDSAGNIQWDRIFSSQFADQIYSISQTTDNGYILLLNYPNGFIKLDSTGNTMWQNTTTEIDPGGGYISVYQVKDGTYIVGGSTNRVENDTILKGQALIKTDTLCNPLREKVYPPDSITVQFYLLCNVTPTSDGGALIHGLAKINYNSDFYAAQIVKVDKHASFEWRYTNTDSFVQNGVQPVIAKETKDGNYIYGATILNGTPGSSENYLIEKLDVQGKKLWTKIIEGESNDYLGDIAVLKEDIYLIAGSSESGIGLDKTKKNLGSSDYWLFILSDAANNNVRAISNAVNTKMIADAALPKIYPNPATDILHIQNTGIATFTLTNQSGKIVITKIINGYAEINVAHLPAGLYYLKNNETGETQKVIITK
jgi:hypothetical protein